MNKTIENSDVTGTLLDCRPHGNDGALQVLVKAHPSGLPMSFVVQAGAITIDELRDLLGVPVRLTLEHNVVVRLD